MYFVWQYPQGVRVLRELSDIDSHILAQVYKGRCVLTGNNVKVSFYPLADSDVLMEMASRHLVSPTMSPIYHQNLVPVGPTEVDSFRLGLWTMYPTERALLRCIELEELSLTYRLCRSRFGFPDHEPSHRRKYGHPTDPGRVPNSWFDIWFSANFPTQTIQYRRHCDFECYQTYDDPESPYPSREPVLLCANVNVVVWLRTEVLMNIYPLPPRAKRQLELGQYLIALWSTTPQDFPSLERPSGLPSFESIQDRVCPPNLKNPDVKTANWHSDLLWAQTASMMVPIRIDEEDRNYIVFEHQDLEYFPPGQL
ncbi:hypothetical protein BDM02DRAFT_3112390 [Thelephora ganbajun]|uniref:Uncharacterized protein n=1 Tax=Thelephora ganbajun TaxID=370292 RepID=A0ACB6ZL56_THEGA|nr:hypothetical protein BDM02DRAFT_3112390 [Thelephora ganbajun]